LQKGNFLLFWGKKGSNSAWGRSRTPATAKKGKKALTEYMALYQRLFVNITQAVRQGHLQTAVYIQPYNLSTIFIIQQASFLEKK
jgi:hypothetical protein